MSRPANTITVSRTRRGTTVKAKGKTAAKALFEAIEANGVTALAQADFRALTYTIHFEDHGQDFLEWDVDTNGAVVASRPCQAWAWVGKEIYRRPAPGQQVQYHDGTGDLRSIRYPVTKVVMHLDVAAPATPAPAAPG